MDEERKPVKSHLDQILADAEKMVADFQEKHVVSSIRVFITETHGGKSYTMNTGGGDWYSCFGHVVQWVEKAKEEARIEGRRVEKDSDGASTF